MAKDDRKIIFINLVNGVSVEHVCHAFHRTEHEVQDIFKYVLQKIKSYCYERAQPPIICDSVGETKQHRIRLLTLLDKVNLDMLPKYNKIIHQEVRNNDDINAFRAAR